MEVAFLIVVFLLVVGFVGWPLLRPSEYNVDESELLRRKRELEEQKDQLLTEIKDLELTHSTGKISTPDFSQMSAAAKRRAAAVLKELDDVAYELKGKKGRKSKKAKKAKKSPPTAPATEKPAEPPASLCPTCNEKVDSSDAFCRNCGAGLKGEAAQTS